MKQKIDISELYLKLINGDRFALSRALTLVESTKPKAIQIARELINKCWLLDRDSWRIGITGTPGVGKSSFIEKIGLEAIKKKRKVAVLSIDPSSTISKGSILGDKTRMESLSKHPEAFIRPSANKGVLGGTEERTFESMILCEAAGFDFIVIETVGVGQSESRIRDLVDHLTVMVMPGSGDDIQGIKRGLLELANVILIHKADGDNINAAQSAVKDYHSTMQSTNSHNPENTVVMKASSVTSEGIESYLDILKIYFDSSNQLINEIRNKQLNSLTKTYLSEMITDFAEKKIDTHFTGNTIKPISEDLSPIEQANIIFKKLNLK